MTETTLRQDRAKPTLAVVIPFYNGSAFIERAIKSVFDQSVAADELIIVNDGSTQEERAFLYKMSEQYPFRIIDQENGGQGSARNAGVAASTSDYICFLDQDDFYLPYHNETLLMALPERRRNLGFVYADLHVCDGDGNLISTGLVKENSPTNPKQKLSELLRYDMHVLPSASLISRTAFDAVGGFDPQLTGYEDDDLFLRIFRKGYANLYVDTPVTAWCIHSGSTSYSIRMSRSRFRYFKKLATAFPDNPDTNTYWFRDCIVPRFSRLIVLDSIWAFKKKWVHRPEVSTILREYVAIICSNKNISLSTKATLRIAAFALTSLPDWLVHLCEKTILLIGLHRLFFPKRKSAR